MARNAGSIALNRTGQTQEAIAAAVGVTHATVSNWMNGRKKPKPDKRALLEEKFGVPRDAWDEAPKRTPRAAVTAAAPSQPLREVTPDTVLEQAAHLEREARQLFDDIKADPESTPLERAKVMNSVTQTLALIAKMTGQFDLGARIFRLPVWRDIERALERGLNGHPEAAAAVGRELRLVEQASGYKRT